MSNMATFFSIMKEIETNLFLMELIFKQEIINLP